MNPPSQKQIRTVALASLLGATIEWYDFLLYGVVAGITKLRIAFCRPQFLFYPNLLMQCLPLPPSPPIRQQ